MTGSQWRCHLIRFFSFVSFGEASVHISFLVGASGGREVSLKHLFPDSEVGNIRNLIEVADAARVSMWALISCYLQLTETRATQILCRLIID